MYTDYSQGQEPSLVPKTNSFSTSNWNVLPSFGVEVVVSTSVRAFYDGFGDPWK